MGVHITHNGDFDALEAYGGTMVNAEVGYWLERILHVPNDLAGDSVKVRFAIGFIFFRIYTIFQLLC